MKPKRQNDLGKDPLGPLLLRLAVPAITAQLVNALYNIVDRMYIGHIQEVGDLALTGLGVAFPVLMFISALSALAGMGGGLAGRDISNHSFDKIFGELLDIKSGKTKEHGQWFDVKEDPMDIRMEIREEED